MRNTLKKIIFICLCMSTGAAYGRRITPSYQSMSTGELRVRAKTRDAEGILVLGARNDTASIPLLKDIAAMPVPTEAELKRLLGVKSLQDPPVQAYINRRVSQYQHSYWESSFAAKAILMKLHAGDYMNDFATQLSTNNFDWKREIIDDLGYTSDPRAVKYLGPLLQDDRTYSNPGSEHAFGRTISEAAAEAMGKIIQPPFMDASKKNPGKSIAFYGEWKRWWNENKDKSSDSAFLTRMNGAPQAASENQSVEARILRQTERQQAFVLTGDMGNSGAVLYTVQIQSPAPTGKMMTIDVAVVLAAGSDILWWHAQTDGPSTGDRLQAFVDTNRLYLTNERVAGFSVKATALSISVQGDHAKTFDEALALVLPKIQATPNETEWLPQTAQTVNLWNTLGQSFFGSGSKFIAPTIQTATHASSLWTIGLQSASKDKATVVLTDDFDLNSATINGKSVYPK
jgi:hypothetical protein